MSLVHCLEAFNGFIEFLVEDVDLSQSVVWQCEALVPADGRVVVLACSLKVVLPCRAVTKVQGQHHFQKQQQNSSLAQQLL